MKRPSLKTLLLPATCFLAPVIYFLTRESPNQVYTSNNCLYTDDAFKIRGVLTGKKSWTSGGKKGETEEKAHLELSCMSGECGVSWLQSSNDSYLLHPRLITNIKPILADDKSIMVEMTDEALGRPITRITLDTHSGVITAVREQRRDDENVSVTTLTGKCESKRY